DAECRSDGNLTAVEPRKIFDDDDAEDGAADLARAAAINAVKTLEYTRQVGGGYPFAGVGHGEPVAAGPMFERNDDLARPAIEFDRIVDQFCEHLLEPHRVCKDALAIIDLVN